MLEPLHAFEALCGASAVLLTAQVGIVAPRRRRRLNRADDGWAPSSATTATRSRAALEAWGEQHGHVLRADGTFAPALPMGNELNREEFNRWLAIAVVRPQSRDVHVERNWMGNVCRVELDDVPRSDADLRAARASWSSLCQLTDEVRSYMGTANRWSPKASDPVRLVLASECLVLEQRMRAVHEVLDAERINTACRMLRSVFGRIVDAETTGHGQHLGRPLNISTFDPEVRKEAIATIERVLADVEARACDPLEWLVRNAVFVPHGRWFDDNWQRLLREARAAHEAGFPRMGAGEVAKMSNELLEAYSTLLGNGPQYAVPERFDTSERDELVSRAARVMLSLTDFERAARLADFDELARRLRVELPEEVRASFGAPTGGLDVGRARERIEAVHADMERRRLDLCEFIEHNALFQMDVPTTRAFERFDLTVRDAALERMGPSELSTMVAELETLYAAAVAHAERVGLDALRDPKLGGTAAKLVRTARDERTPESERRNARTKLDDALRELGLPVTLQMLDGVMVREITTGES